MATKHGWWDSSGKFHETKSVEEATYRWRKHHGYKAEGVFKTKRGTVDTRGRGRRRGKKTNQMQGELFGYGAEQGVINQTGSSIDQQQQAAAEQLAARLRIPDSVAARNRRDNPPPAPADLVEQAPYLNIPENVRIRNLRPQYNALHIPDSIAARNRRDNPPPVPQFDRSSDPTLNPNLSQRLDQGLFGAMARFFGWLGDQGTATNAPFNTPNTQARADARVGGDGFSYQGLARDIQAKQEASSSVPLWQQMKIGTFTTDVQDAISQGMGRPSWERLQQASENLGAASLGPQQGLDPRKVSTLKADAEAIVSASLLENSTDIFVSQEMKTSAARYIASAVDWFGGVEGGAIGQSSYGQGTEAGTRRAPEGLDSLKGNRDILPDKMSTDIILELPQLYRKDPDTGEPVFSGAADFAHTLGYMWDPGLGGWVKRDKPAVAGGPPRYYSGGYYYYPYGGYGGGYRGGYRGSGYNPQTRQWQWRIRIT